MFGRKEDRDMDRDTVQARADANRQLGEYYAKKGEHGVAVRYFADALADYNELGHAFMVATMAQRQIEENMLRRPTAPPNISALVD